MTDFLACAETLLTDLETQLDRVDACLLETDPGALPEACAELRRSALDFARLPDPALSSTRGKPALRRRIEQVAQRLASQRAHLARRSVVVEGALASLLGPRADSIYSVPGARLAFGAAGGSQ